MRRTLTALAAACAVAACDGNPLFMGTGGGGTAAPPVSSDIPAAISGNLESVDYDPVAQTLTVAISGLDSTPVDVVYNRAPALDAAYGGTYQVYQIQEDALDRLFMAVAKRSNDGATEAHVAGDGGQFNRFFMGANYQRNGVYTPPTVGTGPGAGQVSYAGAYAGLDNWSGPLPVVPDPALQMQGAGRVSGDIFLNANFADLLVNGTVFNRLAVDNGTPLADIFLVSTAINADGTFNGTVELGDLSQIGEYGGIFGGTGATSVAGGLTITEFAGPGTSETGIFVLTQCGQPGEDAALCAGTAP